MSAAIRFALEGVSLWAVVALSVLASSVALVAALAARRATRASRAALGEVSALRREAALQEEGRAEAPPPEETVATPEAVGIDPVAPEGTDSEEDAVVAEEPAEPAPEPSPPGPAERVAAETEEQADPTTMRLRRLEHPDPFVRVEAIEGLRGDPALVDAILRAVHDDYPVVRRQAVRALKEAGGPQATRALLDVTNQDPSAEVREEAVAALAAMLRETRTEHA